MNALSKGVALLGLAGSLSLGALLLLERKPPPASAAQAGDGDNDDGELHARLARLERLAGQRAATAISPVHPGLPVAETGAGDEPRAANTPELSLQETLERAAEQNKRETEFLNDTFAREADDPAWSRSFESTLQQSLKASLPAHPGVNVECRGSLCRLAVVLPDAAEQAAFVRDFPTRVPRVAAMRLSQEGEGKTIIHIVREGFPAPQAPHENDSPL